MYSIQKIAILTEKPHPALKLDVRPDTRYRKSQHEQKFDKEIKTRKLDLIKRNSRRCQQLCL